MSEHKSTTLDKNKIKNNSNFSTNNVNNKEKTETQNTTNSNFKCKTCPKNFKTLQACLSHELIHINFKENKSISAGNGSKQTNNNNRRKRKNSKVINTGPKLTGLETTVEENQKKKELKNTVIKSLSECKEGSELNCLCRIFQPMPEDISLIYQSIYVDLNIDLMRTGYEWQISPFGSTIMGMAFKESDIDFYVYPLEENNDYKTTEKIYRLVINVLRRSKRFRNIITIPKARVPIIKCTHFVTGCNLDINVSSVFGVHSSQFIANLFNLDSRIHPFMLIIKIWAKCWNLSGTGRITNYCLILLAITYLQCCQPPVIPSVKKLQENTEKVLVKGINYAFNTKYSMMNNKNKNSLKNEQNIKELLQGFFKFYSEFDFNNHIICPYLGKIIKRQDFTTKQFQYPEYDQFLEFLKIQHPVTNAKRELHTEPLKLNSVICIQDPFCLNHNNSLSIGKSIYELFRFHLIHANEICSEYLSSPSVSVPSTSSSSSTILKSEKSSKEMLIRLLFEEPTPIIISSIREKMKKTSLTSSSLQINDNEISNQIQSLSSLLPVSMIIRISPIESELLYVRQYLRNTYPNQSFNKIEINKFWIEKIIEYTKQILENIFKIHVNELQNDNKNKSKVLRTNFDQTDVYDKNNHNDDDDTIKKYSINLELKTSIDTWSNRKNDFKRNYSQYLQDQYDITKSYDIQRNENNYPANLYCKLILKPDNDLSTLTFTFIDLTNCNSNTNKNITSITDCKSNLEIFFTQYTACMRYFYRAYFQKLLEIQK